MACSYSNTHIYILIKEYSITINPKKLLRMESEKEGPIRFRYNELNTPKFKNILEQILLNNPIVLETNPSEGRHYLHGVVNSKGEVHSSDKDVHFQVEARQACAPLQYTPLDCWLAYNVMGQRKQIIVPIAPLDTDKILELLVAPLVPSKPNELSYDPVRSLAAGIADEIRRVCSWQTPDQRAFLFGESDDDDSSSNDTAPLEEHKVPNLRW